MMTFLFAVIFYYQATGEIYGVHPDLATAPPVPTGVVAKEIPGPSDKIPWPVPPGKSAGREQWSRINLLTGELEVDMSKVAKHDASPQGKKEKLRTSIDDAINEPGLSPKLKAVLEALKEVQ